MTHTRKLVIGGAALTKARNNKHCIAVASEIMDELEPVMVEMGYFDNAPFRWVGLMLRFGLKNEEKPRYQKINNKHGDLPVTIEIDTHMLQGASRDQLKSIFLKATLETLIDIANVYKLPSERLVHLLETTRKT